MATRRPVALTTHRGAPGEAGFTLIELLATMAIMGTILGSITAALGSAARLEANLNARFTAQQTVRLALTEFRQEAHCATAVAPSSGSTSSIQLTLPNGCVTGSGPVTWCTVAATGRYDLWRVPGAACNPSAGGARRWAGSLVSANVFSPDSTVHAPAMRPSVTVNFSVYGGSYTYLLMDTIYLRNGSYL